MDDAQRLSELLHPAQISIIAVTVLSYRNVELDLVIGVVRLRLAYIPRHARSAKHDTRERVVEGISSRNNTDALRSTNPDSIVSKKLFCFVDAIAKLCGPSIDIVEQPNWDILADASRSNVCSM